MRAVEDLPREDTRGPGKVPETRRLLRYGDDSTAQVQSMEAMGRLAGGIAHVFNNLLTAVACEVELALARLSPDDAARKHLREIERVGERGAALARQLLAFSGRQVLMPRLVQPSALLTGMQDRLRHILGDSIELELALEPDVDRVQVDAAQIEQAILNLASNARDVMSQGGRLTLEARNFEVRPGNLTHPMRASPGRWVEINGSHPSHGDRHPARQHERRGAGGEALLRPG
jgi:signal transduction histidine kinase